MRKRRYKLRGRRVRQTAYHEAGHAVIALRLGRAVRRVTVVRDGESLGQVNYYRHGRDLKPMQELTSPRGDRNRRRVEMDVVINLAGALAVLRLGDPDDRFALMLGTNFDDANIRNSLSLLGYRLPPDARWWWDAEQRGRFPLLDACFRCTQQLLAQQWPQVVALAEALLVERSLSGRRVLR
jgi:hypothetical protein